MNLRPQGYEPCELPGCSTLRSVRVILLGRCLSHKGRRLGNVARGAPWRWGQGLIVARLRVRSPTMRPTAKRKPVRSSSPTSGSSCRPVPTSRCIWRPPSASSGSSWTSGPRWTDQPSLRPVCSYAGKQPAPSSLPEPGRRVAADHGLEGIASGVRFGRRAEPVRGVPGGAPDLCWRMTPYTVFRGCGWLAEHHHEHQGG